MNTVQELNPVWAALAHGPRKEEHTILGAALNDHASLAQAATRVQFPATKELLSTVVNLPFWSGDPDSLEEGLHPFCTVYTSTSKFAQDQANLLTYDAFAANGALQMEDVQLFQLVFKLHWPVDYLQLDTTLKLFHNLLVVLFSGTHPLLLQYHRFIKSWNTMTIQLAEYFQGDATKAAPFL